MLSLITDWFKRLFSNDNNPSDGDCIFEISEIEYTVRGGREKKKRISKIICFFALEREDNMPISEYITSLSGVKLKIHESDFLYDGFDYLRGDYNGIRVIVVPAMGIRRAPRKVRKPGWKYVSISCSPDLTIFDSFPGYNVIPAHYQK